MSKNAENFNQSLITNKDEIMNSVTGINNSTKIIEERLYGPVYFSFGDDIFSINEIFLVRKPDTFMSIFYKNSDEFGSIDQGMKVRVLKMPEISPLMIPIVKDYYENDIIPIYDIKYNGIEWKKFEKDLDCLLIKPKETFVEELHRYDSNILCDFVQEIANFVLTKHFPSKVLEICFHFNNNGQFVNYRREWRIFVEKGYGFYCVSEYFEFIKKGLLEYFPSFKISKKAGSSGENSIVIEKVLDRKRVIEMAENTLKKRMMLKEVDDHDD
ncbi:6632_t:CDS:2 [Scutellospora calospora]|uniref:6632_t:CDS:1 n=1 Tax=Scutellospora calospora TaxID=85575 RepID=A0ACA9KAZ5_9GLOM|nr:6632_t:CDS:2 [Scutellospora calospora]